MKLARLVLALSALPFAAIGLGFLLLPHTLASLVGVAFSSHTADHDVRFALVAQLLLYGGLAGARGLAWLVTGAPGALGIAVHAAEVVGFAAGWLALRRLET